MRVLSDGYACQDCILMMANGEIPPRTTPEGPIDWNATEERSEECAHATAGWCCASSEDGEHPDLSYSTGRCQCCGSYLHGWRGWAVKLGD